MFWLGTERNGEYSNHFLENIFFPCAEFHWKTRQRLEQFSSEGKVKFRCGEAPMFVVKLDLIVRWAEGNSKQTLSDKAAEAVPKIMEAKAAKVQDEYETDQDAMKMAARIELTVEGMAGFNVSIWFTPVQA